MSKQDTKSGKANANLKHKGLETAAPAASPFNLEVERGKEIAAASDRARQMIADQIAIHDSRMENQLAREEKYRDYGVQREKSKLMEKQFSSPQPIPNDPHAREVMQKEIDEGAIRNHEKTQRFRRDQIDWQYKYNVDEILKLDREGRLPDHQHVHDQEHEDSR